MKLWIDDLRPAPPGYIHLHSVDEAIDYILQVEYALDEYDFPPADLWIEVIDMDHDAGEYYKDGGDYIEVLKWMERENISWPIKIHSMNPVGVANMRAIIKKNGWKEVF